MKKLLCIFLAALFFLTGFFCFPSFAANDTATNTIELNILEKELWHGTEGVSSISERNAAGFAVVFINAESDAPRLSFFAEFDEIDLSSFTELSISLSVRGEKEKYPLSLTIQGENTQLSHKTTVNRSTTKIYVPIEGLDGPVESISFSFDANDAPISYVNILGISADNTYSYSYITRFSATDIVSPDETVKTKDSVEILQTDGGCSAAFVFSDEATGAQDREILIWVETKNTPQGSVQLVCEYESANDSGDKTADPGTVSRTLTGDGVYSFTVKSSFKSATLVFSSLAKGKNPVLCAAGLSDMGELSQSAGILTECKYADGVLSVSGTIPNDVSIKYFGSKLLLFAIHSMDVSSYDLKKLKPVASTAFSTKFTVSYNTSEEYTEYFYKVVLDTKGGYVPVGDLIYPTSGSAPPPAAYSVSALHGADAAHVFESGISSVIVDVYAQKLLQVEDIYSAVQYKRGGSYYFNREYLTQLDDDIRFYNACSVQVYLRIYSDTEGYLFDYSPDDPDSLALMCAVCSFLSERYPQAQGFIMGSPLNGDMGALKADFAQKKARIICAFCESIKGKNPAALTFIPFEDSDKNDPRISLTMISYYLAKYKAGSTVVLLETSKEDPKGLGSNAASLSAVMSGLSAPTDGSAVMWSSPAKKSSGEVAETFAELCHLARQSSMRFCALSVGKADISDKFFDSVKNALDKKNIISTSHGQFSATTEEPQGIISSYPIWDFTHSYDISGWVSGGSFASPVTAKGNSGLRVLKATVTADDGSSGILIGKPDSAIDASGTVAKVTFTVLSDGQDTCDVSVLFGGADERAQYSCKVKCNEAVTVYCDLSSFAGAAKTDFISLIVGGTGTDGAELEKIELCSSTLSSEELYEKYSTPKEDGHAPILYAAIIMLLATTVTVFFLLLRKKKSPHKGDGK